MNNAIPVSLNLWKGPAFPLSPGPTGCFRVRSTHDILLSSIYVILFTVKGTRLMQPDFGSVFLRILYEPLDNILISNANQYIPADIMRSDPRIISVTVNTTVEQRLLHMSMRFYVANQGQSFNANISGNRGAPNSFFMG